MNYGKEIEVMRNEILGEITQLIIDRGINTATYDKEHNVFPLSDGRKYDGFFINATRRTSLVENCRRCLTSLYIYKTHFGNKAVGATCYDGESDIEIDDLYIDDLIELLEYMKSLTDEELQVNYKWLNDCE